MKDSMKSEGISLRQVQFFEEGE